MYREYPLLPRLLGLLVVVGATPDLCFLGVTLETMSFQQETASPYGSGNHAFTLNPCLQKELCAGGVFVSQESEDAKCLSYFDQMTNITREQGIYVSVSYSGQTFTNSPAIATVVISCNYKVPSNLLAYPSVSATVSPFGVWNYQITAESGYACLPRPPPTSPPETSPCSFHHPYLEKVIHMPNVDPATYLAKSKALNASVEVYVSPCVQNIGICKTNFLFGYIQITEPQKGAACVKVYNTMLEGTILDDDSLLISYQINGSQSHTSSKNDIIYLHLHCDKTLKPHSMSKFSLETDKDGYMVIGAAAYDACVQQPGPYPIPEGGYACLINPEKSSHNGTYAWSYAQSVKAEVDLGDDVNIQPHHTTDKPVNCTNAHKWPIYSAAEREKYQTVHVIYSTHFDFGYTDFAWCSLSRYINSVLPQTVKLIDKHSTFVYTTHPFIVYWLLNCDSLVKYIIVKKGITFQCPTPTMVNAVVDKINSGNIVMHAYPWDGINGILDTNLLNFSFSFISEIYKDSRIKLTEKDKPKTMMQIDVLGYPQPLVKAAVEVGGLQYAYIGQNKMYSDQFCSVRPEKMANYHSHDDPSKSILTLIYPYGYGILEGTKRSQLQFNEPFLNPHTNEALLVFFKVDNTAAWTDLQLKHVDDLATTIFPNATTIKGSTFDAFLDGLAPYKHTLPNITKSMGSLWSRSAIGDALKVSLYKQAAKRFRECIGSGTCPHPTKNKDMFNAAMMFMTPAEHNAGLIPEARDGDAEAAYEERRDMLVSGLYILGNSSNKNINKLRPTIEADWSSSKLGYPPQLTHEVMSPVGKMIELCGYKVQFNKHGGIEHFSVPKSSESIVDKDHTFGNLKTSFNWTVYDKKTELVPIYDSTLHHVYTTTGQHSCQLSYNVSLMTVLVHNATAIIDLELPVMHTPPTTRQEVTIPMNVSVYALEWAYFGKQSTSTTAFMGIQFSFAMKPNYWWLANNLGVYLNQSDFSPCGVRNYMLTQDEKPSVVLVEGEKKDMSQAIVSVTSFNAPLVVWNDQQQFAQCHASKKWETAVFDFYQTNDPNWVRGYPWLFGEVSIKFSYKMTIHPSTG